MSGICGGGLWVSWGCGYILAGVAAGFAALEDFGDLEGTEAVEKDNAS